jgi:hypothetical protein
MHRSGRGSEMMDKPTKRGLGLPRALRCFLGSVGLFVGLLPVLAEAQTSIDQGKSPAEMFSLDCATCHKSARGLANGRNTSALAGFLDQHYTSGKDQAASLAAYVMGAGGGEAGAPARAAKPTPDRARTEEPKREPGKPEEGTPASARLQPPASEEQKRPGDVPSIMQERGRKPAAGRSEPATASRGQQRPVPEVKPAEPPRETPREAVAPSSGPSPAPTAAAPESSPAQAPTESAPANAASGESAPVPRDNIPD